MSHILVQTAYANGGSIKFLEENEINHTLVPTGVKNAHPVAIQYAIGANDEPNGHGTITVDWDKLEECLGDKADSVYAKKLKAFLRISNFYVGDAVANLLLVEAALRAKNYSIDNFCNLYKENANKMFKIQVKDRTAFKTIWDESRLTEP